MATLLLSDLHLTPEPSPLRDGFVAFCDGPARAASAVYILGDLFEAWVGDDIGLSLYPAEIAALHRLHEAGVPVFVLHGNRDFLLGRGFERASGARLLPDPSIVTVAGQRVMLAHGDQWCTDDRDYQRWRRLSRSRLVQRAFLMLPRRRRQRIADRLRSHSHSATRQKPMAIMDVNPQAVEVAVAHQNIATLVHGHTHRPARHRLSGDGREIVRLVLPDWRPGLRGWVSLEAAPAGLRITDHQL